MKQSWVITAAALALASFAGCGPGVNYGTTGTVAGKLTMEGQPMAAETQVIFMEPEKGYAAIANTDAAGNYKITQWNDGNIKNGAELPVGKYRVMIQPPASKENSEPTAEELMANPKLQRGAKVEFPERYRQTHTSGLEFEIKQGANDIPIDIKKV
jgi:hypothetical protein